MDMEALAKRAREIDFELDEQIVPRDWDSSEEWVREMWRRFVECVMIAQQEALDKN